MAEPAIRKMTVLDFLEWEDGTDTRYELVDGTPVAMVPPAVAHGVLSLRLLRDPLVIVEILSPGTVSYDRQSRFPTTDAFRACKRSC